MSFALFSSNNLPASKSYADCCANKKVHWLKHSIQPFKNCFTLLLSQNHSTGLISGHAVNFETEYNRRR